MLFLLIFNYKQFYRCFRKKKRQVALIVDTKVEVYFELKLPLNL